MDFKEIQEMKPFDKMKLHINLSAIFTGLFTVAFAIIISFTYFRTYQSIVINAKSSIERASLIVSEKVNCAVTDVDGVSQTTLGVIPSIEAVNLSNEDLVSYLLSTVKSHPLLYGVYIGTENGSFLQAMNVAATGRDTFLTDNKKYLPREVDLAIRFINRSETPPQEYWYYKNADLKTIAEEKKTPTYDPRVRPWYKGAEETKKLFWTGVYQYNTLVGQGAKASGISSGQPIIKEGKVVGVVGIDVTLSRLSTFISKQKIAETGRAFILDKKGEIIVPFESELKDYPHWAKEGILKEPFKAYMEDHEKTVKFKFDGTSFLAHESEFALGGGSNWLIVFIAPMKEFLTTLSKTQKEVVFISIVILIIAIIFVYIIATRTSKPIQVLSAEVDKIKHFELDSDVRVKTNIGELIILDESIASMRSALHSFANYVPKEIVKTLIEKGVKIELGGVRKELTIVFSDVENFTTIVGQLPTDPFMAMLAEYFDNLSKIILSNEGTVDKYIGDSIMAFWGAPQEVENANIKACTCILLCQAFIRKFNEKQISEGKPPFYTRFGMDCGPVIVGNIGTANRMNYTVIGDAVNISARLEGLSKVYLVNDLITENVATRLDHQFHLRPIDYLKVAGKDTEIKIFQVLGKIEGDPSIQASPESIELCHLFEAAYQAFHEKRYEEAKAKFLAIHEKFPDDSPTNIYLQRLEHPPT